MAYLDIAGSGLLHRIVGTAVAVARPFEAIIVNPVNGVVVPGTAVGVILRVATTYPDLADVQLQVDDTNDFSSPVFASTLTSLDEGLSTVTVAGLVNLTTYYARTRSAEAGSGVWSGWSPTVTWRIDTNAGGALMFVDMNVGVGTELIPDPDATVYTDLNVGTVLFVDADATVYVDLNAGFPITLPEGTGIAYAHVGDVNELTPSPVIWFVRPDTGRPGDGIGIFCFGVGDLPVTYGGVVEWLSGTQWVGANVVSWQTFPPTVNAYTDLRVLDATLGICDPQHSVIEITIPQTALEPGFTLRVRTDGP